MTGELQSSQGEQRRLWAGRRSDLLPACRTLPGTYQVLRTGRHIEPQEVESNPAKLFALAEMLAEAGLPERFHEPANWDSIEAEPHTGNLHVRVAP